MFANISKLFHHSPVESQKTQSSSMAVLKETTSQFISKLQEVKQNAALSTSSNIIDSDKANKCYKKLHRECNRIVVNIEKFQANHNRKNYNAVAIDTLKLNLNLNKFITMTSMDHPQKTELLNLTDVVNDAIKSSTSTNTGNGINMNAVYRGIAQVRSYHC